jgi:hypothetical protein
LEDCEFICSRNIILSKFGVSEDGNHVFRRRHRGLSFLLQTLTMAANRDEALKCIGISQRHLSAGNFPSARRFAEKSIALFPTPEAKQLLERISVQESEPSSSSGPSSSNTNGSAAKASGASAHETSGTTHQRHAGTSSSASTSNGSASSSSEKKRDFTPEQVAVVKRIRKCKVTQYYEIMGLEKACEENDVKKAYRKASSPIICHPLYILPWLFFSSPFSYIQTRMGLQVPTKPSRVRHS